MKTINAAGLFIIASMAIACGAFYQTIFFPPNTNEHEYFIDTKKDAALMAIGSITILVNAGPDAKSLASVQAAMPGGNSYIDLVIITQPTGEYFGGLQAIAAKIHFGAFIYNGRDALNGSSDDEAWRSLMDELSAARVPVITVGARDRITYGNRTIAIIGPTRDAAKSADIGETRLVLRQAPAGE